MEDNAILSSLWHHSKISWMQPYDLFFPPFPPPGQLPPPGSWLLA